MTTLSLRKSSGRSPLRRGLPRGQQLPHTQAMWIIRGFLLIPLMLACFCPFANGAGGLKPPPDGGYLNANTAEGSDALFSLTTGVYNTAMGFQALFSNTTGSDNTATGFAALFSNTTGSDNTATGFAALHQNTTGNDNTANGRHALFYNTTGSDNTANGAIALYSNTTGINNTAMGVEALYSNTTGNDNAATGFEALQANTTGNFNTATGFQALLSNTTGSSNTVNGLLVLSNNTTGGGNTAMGFQALLSNRTGSSNIALGLFAGENLTTGDNNIDIGNLGVAAESNTIRIGSTGTQTATFIAGISGATVANGATVIVDPSGHLGTIVSSQRFKDAIKPMDKASEAILSLKPVTFHYKHDLDPNGIPQFGLVAEEVEKVNPDLVARDAEGKVYTVRYEAVNAMLLNEFIKEHRRGDEQDRQLKKQAATIAKQQKQIKALTTGLQKVSAQIEANKAAPQMAVNNQ